MEYSGAAFGAAWEEARPVVFDVRTLWRRLAALGDRRQPRGKRYGLALVLLLVVLAKLSGEDRPSGIADWVRHRRELLAQALGLDLVRTPHHNTYRRILASGVLPGDLDGEISAFFRDQPQVGRSVLISIDGKTVRGTIHTDDPRGTHLLAAYLPSEGIVLLQVPAGHRDNEIGVAPALLRGIDLRGKIVAADAMHTQREFSAEILAAGGEYLFLVKDNQPTLREEIELLFAEDRTVEGGEVVHDFKTTRQVNKGHGRREVRQIKVSDELKGYCDWPGLEQVFRLERQRIEIKTGEIEQEVVYGLTSLTPTQASPSSITRTHPCLLGCRERPALSARRHLPRRRNAPNKGPRRARDGQPQQPGHRAPAPGWLHQPRRCTPLLRCRPEQCPRLALIYYTTMRKPCMVHRGCDSLRIGEGNCGMERAWLMLAGINGNISQGGSHGLPTTGYHVGRADGHGGDGSGEPRGIRGGELPCQGVPDEQAVHLQSGEEGAHGRGGGARSPQAWTCSQLPLT